MGGGVVGLHGSVAHKEGEAKPCARSRAQAPCKEDARGVGVTW
ncbi:hypothetical protein GWL_17130 [Herbaspirillum sp. GW103]|nr:hypothetical protein GWL_17130 [Herbaspirillum sp. GW103]